MKSQPKTVIQSAAYMWIDTSVGACSGVGWLIELALHKSCAVGY